MYDANFDPIIDRRSTDCAKWDEMDEKYGGRDIIHLGVADMDFQAPEPIREAFRKVVDHGVFGYTNLNDEFYTSIQRWMKKQNGEQIPKEWIVFCPRINVSSSIACAVLTEPGDKILMHSPYYMPLHDAVVKNDRILLPSPLVLKNGRYEMDFQQMEEIADEKTKVLILCNPHNPCCRSWNKSEMERLADFCMRHDMILLSDEIHADIRPSGKEFVSALNLGDRIKERLVYVNSPAKTFNIPGIMLSYLIIPNPVLRKAIQNEIDRLGIHNPNVFVNIAMKTGYEDCDSWLLKVNEYIDANEEYVRNFMSQNMPGFTILPREGTFLLWIDCTGFGLSGQELSQWFFERAKVGVYMGQVFGPEGEGFIRWNLGAPRKVLEEALYRMKHVYHMIEKENRR